MYSATVVCNGQWKCRMGVHRFRREWVDQHQFSPDRHTPAQPEVRPRDPGEREREKREREREREKRERERGVVLTITR